MSKFAEFIENVQSHMLTVVQALGPFPRDENGLEAVKTIAKCYLPKNAKIENAYFSNAGIELEVFNFDGDDHLSWLTLRSTHFFKFIQPKPEPKLQSKQDNGMWIL